MCTLVTVALVRYGSEKTNEHSARRIKSLLFIFDARACVCVFVRMYVCLYVYERVRVRMCVVCV